MKSQRVRLLLVSFVLVRGTIGCGNSEPVVDEIKPAAEEPKPAVAEPDTVVSKPDDTEEPGSSGEILNSIGMKLKRIPAGEFMMGSAKSPQEFVRMYDLTEDSVKDFADEHPQHKVRITRPFCLGVTEVTQGQGKSVMGTEPRRRLVCQKLVARETRQETTVLS